MKKCHKTVQIQKIAKFLQIMKTWKQEEHQESSKMFLRKGKCWIQGEKWGTPKAVNASNDICLFVMFLLFYILIFFLCIFDTFPWKTTINVMDSLLHCYNSVCSKTVYSALIFLKWLLKPKLSRAPKMSHDSLPPTNRLHLSSIKLCSNNNTFNFNKQQQ